MIDREMKHEDLLEEVQDLRERVSDLADAETRCQLAERALLESQRELATIFESAPVAMVLVDEERRVRRANRAAGDFCDRTAEEMVGLRGGEALRCLHSLDDPKGCGFGPYCETCRVRRIVLDALERGESYDRVEAKLPLQCEGQRVERHLLITASPVELAGESLVLVSIEDITDIKEIEEALRERTIRLEERNQELDAFAHTVAHDLKNPLSLVMGYAEVLLDDRDEFSDEQLNQYLGEIGRYSEKINDIIDELLMMAEMRKEEIDLAPLDMKSITEEVVNRLEPMIEQTEAEVVLPNRWLPARGYGPWVEEVWVNYLSNALKYGGPEPRVELGAEEYENGFVRFWVRDHGAGLSAEEQARLFVPLNRLDQVDTTGYGLGLSIVRRVVEKLGGRVGVESEPGQGSTFWFALPEVESGDVGDEASAR